MNPSTDKQDDKVHIPTDPSSGLSFSQRIFSHKSYAKPSDNVTRPDKPKIGGRNAIKLGGIVVGLVLFAAILIGGILALTYYQKKSKTPEAVDAQTVNVGDVKKSGTALNLGDSGQTLTVNSTANFTDALSVKKDLNVGGKLNVGSGLTITTLDVSGATKLSTLTTTGTTTLQGGLTITGPVTINGNTTVTGNGTFSGDISANNVVARSTFNSGNLTITGHITTSGTTPAISANLTVLGSGGGASIVGNDNAGTVTFRAGQFPGVGAGTLGNITFKTPYTGAGPRVILTPNGQEAGELMFYVTHSLTGFSIGYTCRVFHGIDPLDPSDPVSDTSHCEKRLPTNTSGQYSFDYQVIQ